MANILDEIRAEGKKKDQDLKAQEAKLRTQIERMKAALALVLKRKK